MPRLGVVLALFLAATALAQTTQPTSQPTTQAVVPTTRSANRSAEDMLRQMLQPQGQAEPLKPIPDLPPAIDATSGGGAVAPYASTQPLAREGTLLLDRTGRLTRAADGKSFEFTLDSDGSALADPPLVILPNRKLMQLEDRVQNSFRDLKLRVSGEVMEYRGRNYLLLQRWNVLPDSVQPMQ